MALRCCALFTLCVISFSLVLVSSAYSSILQKFQVEALPNHTDTEILQIEDESSHLSRCLYPSDCRDVQKCGQNKSGVYRIFPFGVGKGFRVYCDMVTDGGGWLVLQRRQDGTVDFYRNWQNYTNGFGNLYGEFWLGLEKIHLLTALRQNQLMVNLGRYDGANGYATYSRFRISDEGSKYRLLLQSYSGNIGDSMAYQNGMMFSTYDRDSDKLNDNCAVDRYGAWWYKGCHHSNLNGEYIQNHETTKRHAYSVICWFHWKKNRDPLQFSEMKIRPVDVH